MTQMMDAVSGLFLEALGTDMTAMEEYFPFVTEAFSIMQYTAWCLLFLITVWQLFRVFGGPISEAENPWHLMVRSAIFALLIGYARPIFTLLLDIARAPYTALMDTTMGADAFTFAGIEQVLTNGITTLVSVITIVGLLLIIILMLCLGWNYFKLLLEVVERYIVVGVLFYTSPLAYAMGGSKATNKVFQSWCRMIGSQLLLLVLNVWFLRAFNSSVGHFVANQGALTSGRGSIFLWLFCALAFLKTAQKFDSYLAAMGLSVAQTGSGMGMELLMATRVLTGFAGGASRTAGSVFKGSGAAGAAATGAAGGFMAGFASKFKGNSYVRDAVVDGGTRMGAGGGLGFVARTFGGMAARNGASLTGNSISSVTSRMPNVSGSIAGDIADRSLSNYMPHLAGQTLHGTQITGGHIATTVTGADGKEAAVTMFSAAQYDKPDTPHSVVTASDGSQWYQMASGDGMGAFYSAPNFTGDASEAAQVAATFPDAPEGTTLRTVDDGVLEASTPGGGNSLWYNSAYYEEPAAPHENISSADGVGWYAMTPHAEPPTFDPVDGGGLGQQAVSMSDGGSMSGATSGAPQQSSPDDAMRYNQAQFTQFMPGYTQQVSQIDSSRVSDGMIEVRHADGSGTAFYDKTLYQGPRGDHHVYEDSRGGQWYAIPGTPTVERRPVYDHGKPVYDGDTLRTVNVEAIKYKTTLAKFDAPAKRNVQDRKPPKRK